MIEGEKFARKCDHCGQGMNEGFVIAGTMYYCSKHCLLNHYTQEEYDEMHYSDDSEAFYTEWKDVDDYDFIVKDDKLELIDIIKNPIYRNKIGRAHV